MCERIDLGGGHFVIICRRGGHRKMGKIATASEGIQRELVPARLYLGVIVGVYDLGTQPGYKKGAPEAKFIIEWELHHRGTRRRESEIARNSKGEPFTFIQFVTLKLGVPANPSWLLRIVEAVNSASYPDEWFKTGKVDIETILDGSALLVIVHKTEEGKTRAVLETVAPLDPDDDLPRPETSGGYFELTDDVIRSQSLPSWAPKWLAKFIAESAEWKAVHGSAKPGQYHRELAPADDSHRGRGRRPPAAPARRDDDDDIPF
jgi:hypothetical protein